eukprot:NODE_242_length_11906_cov_0.577454.p8 type:complete len:101 gc:universal NODE_242_length_11906_cov_0.577454:9493-9191(-)
MFFVFILKYETVCHKQSNGYNVVDSCQIYYLSLYVTLMRFYYTYLFILLSLPSQIHEDGPLRSLYHHVISNDPNELQPNQSQHQSNGPDFNKIGYMNWTV